MHSQIDMSVNGACGAQDGAMHRQHGGMHRQIGVAASSACGMHAKSDGTMHKTSAGAHTHRNDTMHMTSGGESDGIADRHCGMHGRIGMAADSACGAHTKSDGAVHKTSAGAYTHRDGAMHKELAGESDRVADRRSSAHAHTDRHACG